MSLDISLTAVVTEPQCVFDANFTHNVTPMWKEAGIYDALYNSHGMTAADVLPDLCEGLEDMRANPDKYIALDSPNGWGTYKHALPWLETLVRQFSAHPTGTIQVST